MSIDVALVNLDHKEFLRPQDMGLRSEIRAVESVPTLFHVAAMRLVTTGSRWAGCRVALIHDGGGSAGLPSWETVCDRKDGWRNVLPEVVQDLVERHRPATDELLYGSVPDLVQMLAEHRRSLAEALADARDDAKDATQGHQGPQGWTPSVEHVAALERELSVAADTAVRVAYLAAKDGGPG